MNETDLIKTTYWDNLAVLQQTRDLENAEHRKKFLAEKKEQKKTRKRERDKKIVKIYLKRKFYDAFKELGINGLSEKELPSILQRAKRHFRMWLAGEIAISSSILVAETATLFSLSTIGTWPILIIIAMMATLVIGGVAVTATGKVLAHGEEWPPPLPIGNRHTPSLGG